MTTLYIKTHNVTGLKYFGKTMKDIDSKEFIYYNGSGSRWVRHLKVHGNDVTTEIYAQFDEVTQRDELVECATTFSRENDIIKSNKWANIIEENGLDGAPKGVKHSDETKIKMSNSSKGKKKSEEAKLNMSIVQMGKKLSTATKLKMSSVRYGKKASSETRAKMSQNNSGHKNNNAIIVDIYDNECNLIITSFGEFKKVCLENDFPYTTFVKSYTTNNKIQRCRNKKYNGWCCIKRDLSNISI